MRLLTLLNGHHATAGMFEDGKALKIFHEEKFNNIKSYSGFPEKSIELLHKLYDLNTVDYVVFGSWEQFYVGLPNEYKETEAESVGKKGTSFRDVYDRLEYITRSRLFFWFKNFVLRSIVTPRSRAKLAEYFTKKYDIPGSKLVYTDHHLNHNLSPLFFYGLEKLAKDVLLISIDGAGDLAFTKAYVYSSKTRNLHLITQTTWDYSLGGIYSDMTYFLGMTPNEHEYKVMGLAAYVSKEKYYKNIYEDLKTLITFDEETLTFKTAIPTNVVHMYFKQKYAMERFDNCAAAVQRVTEEMVITYIKALIKKTGVSTLAVSGGVFMNVKMNQKILELPEVKKVYFMPSCGDESLVIGAAANIFKKNGIKLQPIKTMYLGHSYTDEEVEKFLKSHKDAKKYKIHHFDDIEKKTVELVADYKLVARFKGAGEWGARSLCNRAILGNARDLKTFYMANDQVKMRDFWMPFAPTIMLEWAEKYIKNWGLVKRKALDSTKYMIVTFDSTELAQEHLRAAMHQKDKTLRPQFVAKEDNPELHRLLKLYEKETGMGGLLNTSLNIHGYPLVGTLEQAMFTFENSGLEYMTLENFLLTKKGK